MTANPRPEFANRLDAQRRTLQQKEEQFLTRERTNPQSPYYQGNADPATQRRHFLLSSMAALGVSALATPAFAAATPGAIERPAPENPTQTQGIGVGIDDGGYGARSQFETEVRWRFPTATPQSSWSMTPLDRSAGIITPSGLHFEAHHGGIATIDPSQHMLFIHGMVKQAKKFNMLDVKRFPMMSRICFIECSGNGLTEWIKPTLKTVQGTHGLTSTSEWTGVPLSTLLNEVGVKPGAKWLLCEGGDAAVMTREETSHYTELLPDGSALQFSFLMEAKSVITYPSGEMRLQQPGFHEITGLAWSGRGRVKKVEVSVNGGKTWREAKLHSPVLPLCHTRFTMPWEWDGKEAILQSRCTDETGYIQPTIGQLIKERGTNGPLASICHLNGIQSWKVARSGEVSNVHHY